MRGREAKPPTEEEYTEESRYRCTPLMHDESRWLGCDGILNLSLTQSAELLTRLASTSVPPLIAQDERVARLALGIPPPRLSPSSVNVSGRDDVNGPPSLCVNTPPNTAHGEGPSWRESIYVSKRGSRVFSLKVNQSDEALTLTRAFPDVGGERVNRTPPHDIRRERNK